MAEKNKFKASTYMGEINEREQELNAARNKLIDQEEEVRNMSVTKEKLTLERDYLVAELKTLDIATPFGLPRPRRKLQQHDSDGSTDICDDEKEECGDKPWL